MPERKLSYKLIIFLHGNSTVIMKFDFCTRNLHIYEMKYRLILKNLNHHYKFVETLANAGHYWFWCYNDENKNLSIVVRHHKNQKLWFGT